jgi:hypothetical protein
MSKHTFGPWRAGKHGYIYAGDDIIGVANVPEKKDDKAATVRANSKLMAAAPEMLRLIQRLTSPHMAEMEYRMEAFIDAAELINQLNSDD